MAASFIGGGNRSTWKKPPTCRKSHDWTPSGHIIEQLDQSYKYYHVSYVVVIKVFHCTDYCFSIMSVK